MNGWDALPLTSTKIGDSFKVASDHIRGQVTKRLTGFKRRDVSFLLALFIHVLDVLLNIENF